MKSVLLVEDELPVREALRRFPWEQHGFRLAKSARNGREALDYCRQNSVDIVITDITMPGMNGLDLIRRLRLELPAIPIIVLTVHEDFACARTAMNLGAIHYIVKGISSDTEIAEALTKAAEIRDRAPDMASFTAFQRISARSGKVREGEERARELPRVIHRSGRTCLLSIRVRWRKGSQSYWDSLLTDRFLVAAGAGPEDVLIRSTRDIEFLVADNAAAKRIVALMTENWLGATAEAITGLYCAYQPLNGTEENLTAIRQQLCEALLASFYASSPTGSYPVDGVPWNRLRESKAFDIRKTLDLHAQNAEALRRYLDRDLRSVALRERLHPDDVQLLLISWLNAALARAESARPPGWEYVGTCDYDEITRIILGAAADRETTAGQPYEVTEAVRYLREHLGDPVTLTEVSTRVGVSPGYLSVLLKQARGEGFKELQTRLRMETAESLLQNSALRVYEVARAVGIASYRHFSTMFKKHFGRLPHQYRRAKS